MSVFFTHFIFWASFIALFIAVFTIDLRLNRKRIEARSFKSSLTWSLIWIGLAFIYALAIFLYYPHSERRTTSANFIAGYLTEYSLSIDNLFVFIMIFSTMAVKSELQPKLLQMGILLSIFLRILFIVFGIALIGKFHWVLYIFGAILLWTSWKMAFSQESETLRTDKNILYRWASRIFPIDHDENHRKMFIRKNHKRYATNLFLVFLLIGSTDVIFAVDSIPAIMGISQDPFVVITSNVFALMGLISLFFVLRSIIRLFRFLKYGISFILLFIGLKMLAGIYHPLEEWFGSRSWLSLVVIVACILVSILFSILIREKNSTESPEDAEQQSPVSPFR